MSTMARLSASVLVPIALASPVYPSSSLTPLKRAKPTFGDMSGLPNESLNIRQIGDAFADACTLAKAGRDAVSGDIPSVC